MKTGLILPVVFYFLSIYPAPTVEIDYNYNSDTLFIYLVKQRWHTGIVFQVKDIDTTIWKEIDEFKNFKFVDAGWGDEEFYQYPGDFDLGLAVKALFYPTPSTLRLEGFNFDINRYFSISDFAIKIPLTREQYNIMSQHISDTYTKNEKGDFEILSSRYGGNIKFYKANGSYHLFNTCNTWAARGFKKAGFDIEPSEIILAEDLLHEADKFGIVMKTKNHE